MKFFFFCLYIYILVYLQGLLEFQISGNLTLEWPQLRELCKELFNRQVNKGIGKYFSSSDISIFTFENAQKQESISCQGQLEA